MRWIGRRGSSNVDDQRGSGGGGLPGGLFTKGGIAGLLLVLAISWLTGTNPLTLLQQVDSGQGVSVDQPIAPPPEDDEKAAFIKAAQ